MTLDLAMRWTEILLAIALIMPPEPFAPPALAWMIALRRPRLMTSF